MGEKYITIWGSVVLHNQEIIPGAPKHNYQCTTLRYHYTPEKDWEVTD